MGKEKYPPEVYTADDEAALRKAVSDGFRDYTTDAASRGVKYSLGSKDGVTGIDCAGFVDKATRNALNKYLVNGERLDMPGNRNQNHVMDTGSDDQIANVGTGKGRTLLTGANVKLENLKEGMILGINHGKVAWLPESRHLWNDVSHVALIYRDDDGQLMVGQANVGIHDPRDSKNYNGVHPIPLKDWLAQQHNDPGMVSLYAADMVPMLESYGVRAAPPAPQATVTTPASTVNSCWLDGKNVPALPSAFDIARNHPANQCTVPPGAQTGAPRVQPSPT